MKYQFKFVTFIVLYFCMRCTYSREIILIENQATKEEGQKLESILINKFNLPKELIDLRHEVKICQNNSDAVLHLCLNTVGDLEVRKINEFVVKNSLSVFLNKKKEIKSHENK